MALTATIAPLPRAPSRDPIRPAHGAIVAAGYIPTAAYRFPTSAVVSRRDVPGRSDPRLTGPTWVRPGG